MTEICTCSVRDWHATAAAHLSPALLDAGLGPPGRCRVAAGLHRDAIWRTDRPQRRGCRPQGPPHPSTPVYHPGWRQARRGQPEVVGGPALNPIPQRLIPILTTRLAGRAPGEPAITSPWAPG